MSATVETEHEARYFELDDHVDNGTLFDKDKPGRWEHRSGGQVHEGRGVPTWCPAASHPQEHFEIRAEPTEAEIEGARQEPWQADGGRRVRAA